MSPVGWVILALLMVERMLSIETPAEAAAAGSTCTRTAGCSAPVTITCATPSTRAMRGEMMLSTAS